MPAPDIIKNFVGILSSRLIRYLYDNLVGEQSRVFPEVKPVQLFKLPFSRSTSPTPPRKVSSISSCRWWSGCWHCISKVRARRKSRKWWSGGSSLRRIGRLIS